MVLMTVGFAMQGKQPGIWILGQAYKTNVTLANIMVPAFISRFYTAMFPTQVALPCLGKVKIPQPFLSWQYFLDGLDVVWRYTRHLYHIKIQPDQAFKVAGIGIPFAIDFDPANHVRIIPAYHVQAR